MTSLPRRILYAANQNVQSPVSLLGCVDKFLMDLAEFLRLKKPLNGDVGLNSVRHVWVEDHLSSVGKAFRSARLVKREFFWRKEWRNI